MANISFGAVTANTLPEFAMIAGDEQNFTYNIYDSNISGSDLIDLNAATCKMRIFPYGDPTYVMDFAGTISGSPLGQFTSILSSACSVGLSGVYIHQGIVIDVLGKTHIPAQGKIIIFPNNTI
jgi:hypothetical protein